MSEAENGLTVVQEDGRTCVRDPVDGLLEVRYGLPPLVKFCRSCVISNQRAAPSVVAQDRPESTKDTVPFSDDDLCEPCRIVGEKGEIDWPRRAAQLEALLDKYRSRNGSYDCLVPGSGGKDSIFAAHVLKTRYGMHPLTVTWAPHLYTDVGWRNFQSWIHKGGFDNYLFTADGLTQRKLTALAYRNLLHPFQPFTLGQRHFPAKLALRMGLKLVFYGENAAEYGSGRGEDSTSLVPERFYAGDRRDEVFISGLPMAELARHGIAEGQLDPYLPAALDDIKRAAIEVHYLGYFLKWIPQENFYYAAEHTGFEPNTDRTEGTYSKYNSIDDKVDGFHYWTGFVKFGIGRCTHEASQEIRHGHITREEGVALVHRFDGEFPEKHFPAVLDYLGMERDEFFDIADGFRSPHLWRRTDSDWALRWRVS